MRFLAILLAAMSFAPASFVFAQQNPINNDAHVRFAHFSPDAGPVDFYLNGAPSLTVNTQFAAIGAWQTVTPGTYSVAVVATGNAPDTPLLQVTGLVVEAGAWLTLPLIGSRQRETLQLQTLVEDYSELPIGEARFSLFHAIEGGPAVDVIVNGDALFQLVNYPGSASSADETPNDGFVSSRLVGSNYNLQITINDSPETVLIDLDEVRITPNTDYFFALIGTTESIQVVSATTDLAQPATVTPSPSASSSNDDGAHLRVAHFSSGTPEIDVYINGELSEFGSLGFSEITSFIDLEPGTYSLAIAPAGRTFAEAVIGPIELTLEAGDWFTGALIGTLTNNTLSLHLLEEDFSPLAETDTRLSVFHGFPTIDAIDVRLSDGTLLLQLLAYPGAQGNNDGLSSIDLPLGTYDIQIVEASNPEEVLIELRGTRLLAGRHYFLAVIRAEPPYVFTFTEIPLPE